MLADCRVLAAELGDGVPVGLAVCELVDPEGRVRSAQTIDWRGADLLAEFTAVESDVRAGALAEARFGAGREHPDFLYVTVGSGISHCLMSGGVPRMGVRGAAIGTGAPLVEEWSSGLAIARRAGHASAQDALADPAAAEVVEDAARRLGLALAALVNALDPGAVVVGGGLGLHDGYRARVEAALRPEVYDERRAAPAGAPGGPRRGRAGDRSRAGGDPRHAGSGGRPRFSPSSTSRSRVTAPPMPVCEPTDRPA